MPKQRTITSETRAKWRAAALANKPWLHSTGPKTPEGKAQAVRNGKTRQHGELSYRESFALAKKLRALACEGEAGFKTNERTLRSRSVRRSAAEADGETSDKGEL